MKEVIEKLQQARISLLETQKLIQSQADDIDRALDAVDDFIWEAKDALESKGEK